jgi:hypothetical protein
MASKRKAVADEIQLVGDGPAVTDDDVTILKRAVAAGRENFWIKGGGVAGASRREATYSITACYRCARTRCTWRHRFSAHLLQSLGETGLSRRSCLQRHLQLPRRAPRPGGSAQTHPGDCRDTGAAHGYRRVHIVTKVRNLGAFKDWVAAGGEVEK